MYYGTGEVARILGTEIWRVQKYLDSPQFGIRAVILGGKKGQGSRRIFSEEEVEAMFLVHRLTLCGINAKIVGQALKYWRSEECPKEGGRFHIVFYDGESAVFVVTPNDEKRLERMCRKEDSIRHKCVRCRTSIFELSISYLERSKRMTRRQFIRFMQTCTLPLLMPIPTIRSSGIGPKLPPDFVPPKSVTCADVLANGDYAKIVLQEWTKQVSKKFDRTMAQKARDILSKRYIAISQKSTAHDPGR